VVTLAGLQNVVAGGGSNDGQGDGAARRVGYKGVDSKVHPKGNYERGKVCVCVCVCARMCMCERKREKENRE